MPQRTVALVTGGARRIGRAIALELARARLRRRGALPQLARRRARRRAPKWRRRRGAPSPSRPTSPTSRLRGAGAAAARALRPARRVVNNASLFEYDDVESFGYAALERHWRANTAPAVLLARALQPARRRARRHGLRRQPARPEAVEPEPRLPLLHPVARPRSTRRRRCWRRRWRRRCASAASRPA